MGISNNFSANVGQESKSTLVNTNFECKSTQNTRTELLDENGKPVKLSKTGALPSDQFQHQGAKKPEKQGLMQKVGNFFKEHPHAQGCTEMLLGAGAVAAACTFSLPFGVGAIAFLAGSLCFGAGVMDFDKATEKQNNEQNK